MKTKKPVAVLISDVHYDLPHLELADTAMKMAIGEATKRDIPVIIAGDLHETKANLRGECVNALRETFKDVEVDVYLAIGNHDKLNEKSNEHSLNFLSDLVKIVNSPTWSPAGWIFPYYSDVNKLKSDLSGVLCLRDAKKQVILHQGLIGADGGDYFQDPTALRPEDVAGVRVLSGHYHRRQTIKLPDGGVWDFIGNPYTRTFGEAADPEKGFQILYDDGSLEFKPTNLRKHIKICIDVDEVGLVDGQGIETYRSGDLLWAEVCGPKNLLFSLTREKLGLPDDARLDLIPTDGDVKIPNVTRNGAELLDDIIDKANYSPEHKQKLKELWRRLRG